MFLIPKQDTASSKGECPEEGQHAPTPFKTYRYYCGRAVLVCDESNAAEKQIDVKKDHWLLGDFLSTSGYAQRYQSGTDHLAFFQAQKC